MKLRISFQALTIVSLLMATLWVSSAGAQTYPQDYYTLRLYQTN